jgi:hypothetical protein
MKPKSLARYADSAPVNVPQGKKQLNATHRWTSNMILRAQQVFID